MFLKEESNLWVKDSGGLAVDLIDAEFQELEQELGWQDRVSMKNILNILNMLAVFLLI